MKEKDLRRFHRVIGIPFAFFIVLQAASGIMLSLDFLFGGEFTSFASQIHYRLGVFGDIYRVVLGAGLLWMALSGFMIWRKIRSRTKGTGA
jgi:hypothetical protein